MRGLLYGVCLVGLVGVISRHGFHLAFRLLLARGKSAEGDTGQK